MGSIVIANMQAQLTLDTHTFDDALTKSEQRLTALEQRTANLGSQQNPNVGKTQDPNQQLLEDGKLKRSAEIAATAAAHAQASSQVAQSSSLQAASIQKVGEVHAAVTQKILQGQAQVTAGFDNTIARANALHASLSRISAPGLVEEELSSSAPFAGSSRGSTAGRVRPWASQTGQPRTRPATSVVDESLSGTQEEHAYAAMMAAKAEEQKAIAAFAPKALPLGLPAPSMAARHQRLIDDGRLHMGAWAGPEEAVAAAPAALPVTAPAPLSGDLALDAKGQILADSPLGGKKLLSGVEAEAYVRRANAMAAEKAADLSGYVAPISGGASDWGSDAYAQKLRETVAAASPVAGGEAAATGRAVDVGMAAASAATSDVAVKAAQVAERKAKADRASKRAQDLRVRHGLPGHTGDQVGPSGEAMTNEEWLAANPPDEDADLAVGHTTQPGGRPKGRTGFARWLLGSGEASSHRGPGSVSFERSQVLQTPIGSSVEGFANKVTPDLGKLLPALTSITLAVASFGAVLGDATVKALQASKQNFELETTMAHNVPAWNGSTAAIDKQIQGLVKLGFTQDASRASFTHLVDLTQNEGRALTLQAEASDLARAKGISLTEASSALGSVIQGNTGVLRQYGIMVGDNASQQEAFRKLLIETNGAAAGFAATAAGSSERFHAGWDAALEKIGDWTLSITDFFGAMADKATQEPFSGTTQSAQDASKAIYDLIEAKRKYDEQSGTASKSAPQQVFDAVTSDFARGAGKVGDIASGTMGVLQAQNMEYSSNPLLPSDMSPEEWQYFTQYEKNQANANMGGLNPFGYQDPRQMRASDAYKKGFAQTQGIRNTQAMQAGGVPVGAYSPLSAVPNFTPPAQASGAGQLGSGGFYANEGMAVSSITAMSDEMSKTDQAIKGVQAAFQDLALFHVDYSAISGKVDEWKAAVVYLQKAFVDAYKGFDPNEYRTAQAWMQVAAQSATMISTSAKAFTDMFVASGTLPTPSEMLAFEARIVSVFNYFEPIAEKAMPNGMTADSGAGLAVAKVGAWSTATGQLFDALSKGAATLKAIPTLPSVDDTEVTKFIDDVMSVQKKIMDAINGKMMGGEYGGKVGGVNTDGLGNAATVSDSLSKLMDFASKSEGVLAGFHGLRIPTKPEIEKFGVGVTQIKDMMVEMATASSAPTTKYMGGEYGGATENMDPILAKASLWATNAGPLMDVAAKGMTALAGFKGLIIPDQGQIDEAKTGIQRLLDGMVSMANAHFDEAAATPGGGDRYLTDAGIYADNAGKLVGVAQAGVATLQNMRRLHIPSEQEMQDTLDSVHSIITKMASFVPKDSSGAANGESLVEAGKWSDDAQKIVGVVATGVGALQSMRRLYQPGDISGTVDNIVAMVNDVASQLPNHADAAIQAAGVWADSAGKVVGVLSGGVQVLQGMRRLYMPGKEAISEFVAGVDQMAEELISIGGKQRNDKMLGYVEDWANAVGPAINVAASAAGLFQTLRHLREPSVQAVDEFVGMVDYTSEKLMSIGGRQRDDNMLRDIEAWATANQGVFSVANSAAQLFQQMRTFYEPTKTVMDEFIASTDYVASSFDVIAQKYNVAVTDKAQTVAESEQAVFTTLNSAAEFFIKLPDVGKLPADMITGFFDNLDEGITEFNTRADAWDKGMSFNTVRVSDDMKSQFDALSSAGSFMLALGQLKPDYSNAIRGFFGQLSIAMDMFAAEAPHWHQSMSRDTDQIAKYMKGEGEALSAALDPFSKMQTASLVRPEQIEASFRNITTIVGKFSSMADSPGLKGEKRTSLKQFAGDVGDIFGNIKTTLDAVNLISQPGVGMGTMGFAATLENFFMNDVGVWVKAWSQAMNDMSNSSEKMSGRVLGAVGSLPMNGAAGNGSIPAQRGGGGGGAVYNNCVILDNLVLDNSTDIATLANALVRQATNKQGGIPVGKNK